MWQFFENGLGEQIVRALCWTFIHSLWQGLLAALLTGLIIAGTRKSTALLRYNLLTLVLFLFVAGAVVTFAFQWGPPTEVATVNGTVSETTDVAFTNTTATLSNDRLQQVHSKVLAADVGQFVQQDGFYISRRQLGQ